MCKHLKKENCNAELSLLINVGNMTYASGKFTRYNFIDALVYFQVDFSLWRTFQTLLNYETFYIPPFSAAEESAWNSLPHHHPPHHSQS